MVIAHAKELISGFDRHFSDSGMAMSRSVVKRWRGPGSDIATRCAVILFGRKDRLIAAEIAGYQAHLDGRDDLQRQMAFGIFDPLLTKFISGQLRTDGVFFDLGANVGYYSLVAARCVGRTGEVHAFEPVPQNAQRLRELVEANNITQLVVNEVAVGATSGELTLHVGDQERHSGWASVVESPKRPIAISVKQVTIDDYLANGTVRRPNLIKIDIEGAEPEALYGMARLLESDDAPDLIIEVNPFLLKRLDRDPFAIISPLLNAGYHGWQVGPWVSVDGGISPMESEIADCFFSRNSDQMSSPP